MLNRVQWINSYQNRKTRKQAGTVLSAFDKFLASTAMNEADLFSSINKNDLTFRYSEIQKIINFWVSMKISAKSIRNYFGFLKNWFWYNNIILVNEDLRAYVKFPRQLKDFKEPLELKTIQQILEGSENGYKTLWLILASSGMRIQEALSFDYKSIEWGDEERPTRIILSPLITKYSEGREVFISRQASYYLKTYYEDFKKIKPDVAETYMARLRRSLKLTEKYSNGKNYKVHIHAFKSFFMTAALMKHGEKYSHALGGHTEYLPEYYRIPKDKRELMYLELEPDVTI